LKIQKLKNLFSEKYPKGFLQKRDGKIAVFFGEGKTYFYSNSHYKIAEKLELIPKLFKMDRDVATAIEKLEKNSKAKIKAVLLDTLKDKWSKEHKSIIESKIVEQKIDQYDRSYSAMEVKLVDLEEAKNESWIM